MRFKGKLKSWNDDRGFGFIDPIQGGEEIFVHIKAISPKGSRPRVNELLWFEIELEPQGRKRAKNVEYVRRTRTPGHNTAELEPPAPRGAATLMAIPAFVVLYIAVSIVWEPSLVLAAIYLGASVVTFFVYAKDKSAAQRGEQRTPEVTLHFWAFACGWPGALFAQQFLRHKSSKREFRVVFWATVILNVAGFLLVSSPLGQTVWSEILPLEKI